MGLWSSIKRAVKKAVKWVVQKAKAVGRVLIRVGAFVWGLVTGGIWDAFFGFLTWPRKKLTLQIFILSDSNGYPVVKEEALTPSIEYARRVLRDRLNITLRPYVKEFVKVISEPAPKAAIEVKPCTTSGIFSDEFGDAGEYFAKHLAGWNVTPVSLKFPITVFVIKEIRGGFIGCSAGDLTDYVLVDIDGVNDKSASTMAHEIGHACGFIRHWGTNRSDLMWANTDRGDNLRWWHKNVIRKSRHVRF
jgi:hypothetical protein